MCCNVVLFDSINGGFWVDTLDDVDFVRFHGTAVGRGDSNESSSILYDSAPARLKVVRSGAKIAPVTSPCTNLIVAEFLRDRLKDVPFVQFVEVDFVRLYDTDDSPAMCDLPRPRTELCGHGDRKALALPDRRERFPDVGRYYELAPPLLELHGREYGDAVQIRELPGCPFAAPRRHSWSPSFLAAHPIVKSPLLGWIVHEEIFAILDEYIDRRFFWVSEVMRVTASP